MELETAGGKSKHTRARWPAVLFLAALAVLVFAFFLPSLGLYWDDWAKLYVYRVQGSPVYWQYYQGDRPFSAWTHILLTPALGVSPAGWQVFTLGMRAASSLLTFSLLMLLRPGRQTPALMAGAFFLVYPLFTQQPIAVTYHQQWLQYFLILASWNCMLLALRPGGNRPLWTALSLASGILQLTITEYFAPLELLRPILIWFSLREGGNKGSSIARVIKTWLPYLALLILFLVWRFFLLPAPIDETYQSDRILAVFSEPADTLPALGRTILVDLAYIFFGSWSSVLDTRLANPLSLTYLGIMCLSLLAGAGSFIFFSAYERDEEYTAEGADTGWLRAAAAVGLPAVLFALLPAWLTHSQVVFDGHSDRYALAALFGLSLLASGLVEWLGRSGRQKAVLAGLIITLGCGFHLRNSFDYQKVWEQQLRLYWQLHWRAPGLQAQTAVFSEHELIQNQGLFSMSAALNQLYPQNSNDQLVDFWFFTLQPTFAQGPPSSFNLSHDTTFRTLRYIGSSPGTLLVHDDPSRGNCLWVLRAEDRWNPYLSELERAMLPISNLERIRPAGAAGYPPEELFGQEPRKGWCYSFEKAELAWQMQDWRSIADTGAALMEAGFSPLHSQSNSPREWWPFIIGFARSGDTRTAITLSQQSLRQDRRYHDAICGLWKSMDDLPDVGVGISELGCME